MKDDPSFERYQQVRAFVDAYREYTKLVMRDALVDMLRRIWRPSYWKMFVPGLRDYWRVDLLGEQLTEYQRQVIEEVVAPERKRSPFFGAILRGSSPRHLACLLHETYPDMSFRSVLAVHEWRAARSSHLSLTFRQVFAGVLAIGAFLVQSAPGAAVTRWPLLVEIQVWSYVVMLASVGYLGIFLAPFWISQWRETLRLTELGEVIKYATILSESKAPGGSEGGRQDLAAER